MAARVFITELDVNSQLRSMGLARRDLLKVVRACVAAYGEVTPFDPPSASGYEPYRIGTRVAREVFVPGGEGWEQDDTSNFSTIRHDVRRLKIAVMNTDDVTGEEDASPRNRSRKGILHARALGTRTGWLPGLPKPEPDEEIEHETWYLCLYIRDDVVRAELSLPKAIENSYIVAWDKRIILVGPDDWNEEDFGTDDLDEVDEFEPEVRRKR